MHIEIWCSKCLSQWKHSIMWRNMFYYSNLFYCTICILSWIPPCWLVAQDHWWMWTLLNGYGWWKTRKAPISCGFIRAIKADSRTLFWHLQSWAQVFDYARISSTVAVRDPHLNTQNTMDMHSNWNLMLGILPPMESFENVKEHVFLFHPFLMHYLHFIVNHASLVVLDHWWMS